MMSLRRPSPSSVTLIAVSAGGTSVAKAASISVHLAAIMAGKGVVVSTFDQPRRRQEAALRLRRSPFHNITTRLWDGRHTAGKAGSYDGVVVDAMCSAIGSWRRHPDARWTVTAAQIPELAASQLQTLATASAGVRPGGTLVYTVATVTRLETFDVIDAFLRGHPEFGLEAFPHPLEEATTTGMLQLWPQHHDGEARFIARLHRKTIAAPPRPGKSKPSVTTSDGADSTAKPDPLNTDQG